MSTVIRSDRCRSFILLNTLNYSKCGRKRNTIRLGGIRLTQENSHTSANNIEAKMRLDKRTCNLSLLKVQPPIINQPDRCGTYKLKSIERRLSVLKKHLEQTEIYLKFKGKKGLNEADKTLFTAAKSYLDGVMNGNKTLTARTWREEYAS